MIAQSNIKYRYCNDINVKKKLIEFVFSKINIINYKYKILEKHEDLELLKKTNHVVFPNYSGINGVLIFVKLGGIKYSCVIDRKTIKYTHNPMNIDVEHVKIYNINCQFDDNIYNGSIIEGVFNYDQNNLQTFIIYDVYYFCGNNLLSTRIKHKFINMKQYFSTNDNTDTHPKTNIILNKYYNLPNIRDLIHEKCQNDLSKLNIKGIVFYPEISGLKLLFMNNINSVMLTFEVHKEKTDVYKLYLCKITEKDGKKVAKFTKIDIAYIPDIKCSKMCEDLFSDNPVKLAKCKYVHDKKKWIITDLKVPTDQTLPDSIDLINNL